MSRGVLFALSLSAQSLLAALCPPALKAFIAWKNASATVGKAAHRSTLSESPNFAFDHDDAPEPVIYSTTLR